MRSEDGLFLVLGILLCQAGWFLMENRGYDSWRFGYVDFGDLHFLFGISLFGLGAVAVIHTLAKLCRDRWKP